MIHVTVSVSIEDQRLSRALVESAPPEHERHGQMCHAFDGAIMSDHLRGVLRTLGWVLVCAEEALYLTSGYTEYWRRITD